MEFGKIEDISFVNWTLPAEDPLTISFLAKNTSPKLDILYGTPAWGHKEWVGKIYPEKTKASDYLYFYSRHFTCIELNTSHYRIPTAEQSQKWLEKVPTEFLFCPKIFNGISHSRNGLVDRDLLKQWTSFLNSLDGHTGPCFLQLPPHFDYSQKAILFSFLKSWPDEFSLSLEFRHPSWFEHCRILPALTEYLQSRNIGLVITDVAGRRDVLHTSISADFSLLRFIGNSLHESDHSRSVKWCERFLRWQSLGLKKLFLFVHEPDDILAPEMTDFFLDELKKIGWNLRKEKQATVFEKNQLSLV